MKYNGFSEELSEIIHAEEKEARECPGHSSPSLRIHTFRGVNGLSGRVKSKILTSKAQNEDSNDGNLTLAEVLALEAT